jgi:acylphosphatase
VEKAEALGVSGWVRNVPTGQVELVACGDDAAIAQLHAWLLDGPPGAHVAQVESREYRSAAAFDGFTIRR